MNNTHQIMQDITEGSIYLMGGSFILGSLLTILTLVLLEFMRVLREEREAKEGQDNAE